MVSEASRVEHEYLPPTVPMIMSRYPRPALPETAWQHPEQTGANTGDQTYLVFNPETK